MANKQINNRVSKIIIGISILTIIGSLGSMLRTPKSRQTPNSQYSENLVVQEPEPPASKLVFSKKLPLVGYSEVKKTLNKTLELNAKIFEAETPYVPDQEGGSSNLNLLTRPSSDRGE
ncbi:MAG: hypothetical protein AABX38_00530 [Candidatus Micrarchaeota archaeon]